MTPVRAIRVRANLSVRQAARAAGISASHFAALERAAAPLTYRRAQRLADALGCRMTDLLAPPGRPRATRRRVGRGRRPARLHMTERVVKEPR